MCYVVLSDVHANYTALKAALDVSERVAAVKKFYFLGDLLGYGPVGQVIDCMDWLHYQSHIYEENGDGELRWVPGNHDAWAVTQLGRVRPEGSITLQIQRSALEQARAADWDWFAGEVRAALRDESRSLLTKTWGVGDGKLFLAFTHAAVARDERRGTYLYPWLHSILRSHFALLRAMSDAQTKILFCGHTHLPYLAQILPDERHTLKFHSIKYGQPVTLEPGEYIISPGSVGHPRDGDPRAAFALFEPETRAVKFCRVEYDTRPVVTALAQERFTLQLQHEMATRYLIQMDKPRLQEKYGLEIDLETIPRRIWQEYRNRVDEAYIHLIREIETGAGGEEEQRYRTLYRAPEWDLEVL
ncbi:MAG: metallophosphoesterase [Anaerolineae bacterium]|nr:metallophosphoesterase [Anaerolineae bacterium]